MSTLGEKKKREWEMLEEQKRSEKKNNKKTKRETSHALEENTHSHPTVAEAELTAVAVVVVVEKATCVGLETLVTSCCCWLELEACRLRAP